MCGIICYFGSDNSINYLIKGIKSLEYRGYDSFGCALYQDGSLNIYKDVGKIEEVIEKYSIEEKQSNRAMFHTRWATHGGIEKRNSHPHTDCTGKIAVVHNGIIENWAQLKKKLRSHTFQSETDTEIISHMIEDYLKEGLNLVESVKSVTSKIVGLSSFVVMHTEYPYMVAYKNGSPLLIGLGKKGIFISSDVPSLINFTKNFIFLHDGDIITFSENEYSIKNYTVNNADHPIINVDMNPQIIEKGNHKHFMEKEIFEQPAIWKKFEAQEYDDFHLATNLLKKCDKIFLIGSGSSYHAAMYGAKLFVAHGIQAIAINGEEIVDYSKVIDDKSVFIVISQSGETADLISGLTKFNKTKKIGIINVPSSSIARKVDVLLKMRAGVEKAVPSTKSFTSSLLILNFLSAFMNNSITSLEKEFIIANNEIYNFFVPSVLNAIESSAEIIHKMDNVFVVGRNKCYIYSLEGALKLKECTYIHAEAFDLSGLKHGSLSLIDNNSWVIALLEKETMNESLMNIQELKARGAKIIGISPENNDLFDKFIRVPNLENFNFMPIVMTLQLLSYEIAIFKKINPDMPRNLAKSVTVR
jgi:glucosamine--fructose-6-phosphate aminotransferase (isomerizing)